MKRASTALFLSCVFTAFANKPYDFWKPDDQLRQSMHPLILEEVNMPLTIVTPMAIAKYDETKSNLDSYRATMQTGTDAKQEYCERHGYTQHQQILDKDHPEWNWALRKEGDTARENPKNGKHFVSRSNRTAGMYDVHPRHAKSLALIDFLRDRPDYLGWILMVDADTFIGNCGRSLLPFQLQMITSGKADRIGGAGIQRDLWPQGARFSYDAEVAKDRKRWGNGGIGVGALAPWKEILRNDGEVAADSEANSHMQHDNNSSRNTRFPSMHPGLIKHLRHWGQNQTQSNGGTGHVLTPPGTPWLERTVVALAEHHYSNSGVIMLRLTTPQRRRRVEFFLRRWWELGTDNSFSDTIHDQGALRAFISHDFYAPARGVQPVPMQALTCQRMKENKPFTLPQMTACWHRCIQRWEMALGHIFTSQPGDSLPEHYANGFAFPQENHGAVMKQHGGNAMSEAGKMIAHNLASHSAYSAPVMYFPSFLGSAVGSKHKKRPKPTGFSELHCMQPSVEQAKGCIVVHTGSKHWHQWKGKVKCYA